MIIVVHLWEVVDTSLMSARSATAEYRKPSAGTTHREARLPAGHHLLQVIRRRRAPRAAPAGQLASTMSADDHYDDAHGFAERASDAHEQGESGAPRAGCRRTCRAAASPDLGLVLLPVTRHTSIPAPSECFVPSGERSPLTHRWDGYVAGMTMVALEGGSFRMGSRSIPGPTRPTARSSGAGRSVATLPRLGLPRAGTPPSPSLAVTSRPPPTRERPAHRPGAHREAPVSGRHPSPRLAAAGGSPTPPVQ